MRKAGALFTLTLAILTVLAGSGSARLDRADMTTRAAIEEAHRAGAIDESEMILEMAYSLYAPWKLAPELRGGRIDKSQLALVFLGSQPYFHVELASDMVGAGEQVSRVVLATILTGQRSLVRSRPPRRPERFPRGE